MINTLINLIINNLILFFVFLNLLLVFFLLNYSINLIGIVENIFLYLQFVILPVLNRIVQFIILLMLLSLIFNGTLNTIILFNYLANESFISSYSNLTEIIKDFNFFGGEKKEVANEDLLISYPDSTVRASEIVVEDQLTMPIGKYNKDKDSISVEEVQIFFKGNEEQYRKILLLEEKSKFFWENISNINDLSSDMNKKLSNYTLMYKHNYNKPMPPFYIPKIANFGWVVKSDFLTVGGYTCHYDLIREEDIENLSIILKTTNISDNFEIFIRKNLVPPNNNMQFGLYSNNHPYAGMSISATKNDNAVVHSIVGLQGTHSIDNGVLKDKFYHYSKQDFLGKERDQYIEKDATIFSSETVATVPIENAFKKSFTLIGGCKFDGNISENNETVTKIDFSKLRSQTELCKKMNELTKIYTSKGRLTFIKCVTTSFEKNTTVLQNTPILQNTLGKLFPVESILKTNKSEAVAKFMKRK